MTLARRRATAAAAALGLALAVAGCSTSDAPNTAGTAPAGDDSEHAAGTLPGAHVHGVGIDPKDGVVYLATHEGLYRYGDEGPTQVGPVIDLMGFTVADAGRFYASGHPGPGVDLPNPVGLIESTDGGQSWEPLSRQGESDFHSLTASPAGVLAFDGRTLSSSDDGRTWRDLTVPVAVFAMDVSPDGRTVVVTSESGPGRSTDAGATWEPIADAPLLQVVDWADERTVVGVTPDGAVVVSEDAGASWQESASVGGPPQAVAALRREGEPLRVVVATQDALLESDDLSAGFTPLPGA